MSCKSEKIKVLVVDDKKLYAKGTVALLCTEPSILVVGTAKNGTECISLVGDTMPHVILLDINLLDSSEINYMDEIKKVLPGTKIIIMTGQKQDYVSPTMSKGSEGILFKDCSLKEMTQAINRVHKGGTYFPQSSEISLQCLKNCTRLPFSLKLKRIKMKLLTTREIEIMALVAEGFHDKEIASMLGTKVRIVDLHLKNILTKLGVCTRFEAALLWAFVDNNAI